MIESILHQFSSIILSLIGISFIIVFHEFGHYVFCKLFNVYTPTFSIGIGKILYSKKIGDTDFCISAGPIGGYVEVASESGINGSLGFNQIPYYQKVLMMLGGIMFNFILAYLLFVVLFFTGMPDSGQAPYETNTTVIAKVQENSINLSNIHPNDQLISVDNQNINNDLTIARKIISSYKPIDATAFPATIPAAVNRSGEIIHIDLALKGPLLSNFISKQLEVSFEPKPSLSLSKSIQQAYIATNFYLGAIINGLKDMASSRNTNGLIGPLKAVMIGSKSSQKGFKSLLFFLALISINLGFMNLLPLPIFDGGQFVIFTIEAITRKELSEKVRHAVGICSWALAIGLLVVFTVRDLYSLIF
ncbi:MAG: M50 family metallopeptidase [Candidatus Dependentiae bacterium]|nr:M50 family metallopeptidase [Candidatus Dependentiae bacterium]